MGALGRPREEQGPFPAASAKSLLHVQPVQLAELSMELMWPCEAVPALSWRREKQRHESRAGLCRAAWREPIAVLLQQTRAPSSAWAAAAVSEHLPAAGWR